VHLYTLLCLFKFLLFFCFTFDHQRGWCTKGKLDQCTSVPGAYVQHILVLYCHRSIHTTALLLSLIHTSESTASSIDMDVLYMRDFLGYKFEKTNQLVYFRSMTLSNEPRYKLGTFVMFVCLSH